MVGLSLCADLRSNGTDADSVRKRVPGEGHGRPSPVLFSLVVFLVATAFNAGANTKAFPAGRKVAPRQLQQSAEKPPTPQELAAARGVEAMFVDLMIREMRKSVPENEFMPPSPGERIYREMLDNEYSRIITESGSIGLAELVLAQLRGKR
jgi:flagellar protein FlgJ